MCIDQDEGAGYMEYNKFVPFISFMSAVIISVVAICVIGAPDPSVGNVTHVSPETYTANTAPVDVNRAEPTEEPKQTTYVVSVTPSEPDPQPEFDIDAIQRVLDSNRVFDEFVFDVDALIDEAQIVLLSQCEDADGQTVIKRDIVDGFISQLYGRTIEHDDDDDDLYYTVAPRGFDTLSQTVVNVEQCDSGICVTSMLKVGDSDTEYTVVTVMSPAQTDFGYIILSADIM